MSITHRVFIVGCPRSGTTVTQAIFAATEEVFTLPETHFYESCRRLSFSQYLRRSFVSPSALRTALKRIARANNLPIPSVSLFPRRVSRVGQDLRQLLDDAAYRAGKTIWVEKSPEHLFYLESIKAAIPHAKIVHVLRPAEEVIASLQAVALTGDEIWEEFRDLKFCARYYNKCVEASRSCIGKPGHCFFKYQDLLAEPELAIRALFDCVGLAHTPVPVDRISSGDNRFVTAREFWKQRSEAGISIDPERRNRASMTQERLRLIGASVVDINSVSWCCPID